MTSHSIAPIPVVAAYFGDPEATPVVVEEYTPGRGWTRSTWRKRISRSYADRLRRESVTSVTLEYNGRHADFAIKELLR